MKPNVKIGRVTLEMADPTFGYGSVHVAHVPVSNPTPESFVYDLILYLALTEGGTRVVEESISFTLAGGASATKDVTVTMPSASGGPYHVYIDVSVAGVVIARYIATDTVTVEVTPDIDIGPIEWD
ncbi:unnamed protein product [marine sediment metagenome]|uniref:CARDB domain-containing protein n=1 Tax=marine sediment metagenome TaxID=412755 RepID=X1TLZ6_9ZZZZ